VARCPEALGHEAIVADLNFAPKCGTGARRKALRVLHHAPCNNLQHTYHAGAEFIRRSSM
jgi:hypothetical protein